MPGILGLSIGTSNVAAALFRDGLARTVRNQQGTTLTPAVVSRTAEGDWRAGQPAKRLAVLRPRDTVWDFLRLLGRPFSSPEVRSASELAPFALVEGARREASVLLGGEPIHPAALVALLIAKLKAAAENEAGEPVESVVIAHPAYFHTGQRRLLGQAAKLAGFERHRFSAATSVAALAMDHAPPGISALCDLGGGSFGIAILEMRQGVVEVLARESDASFAGEDIDRSIARRLQEEIYRKRGFDVSTDPAALAHLKEAAERAKRWLSALEEVEVDVPLGERGVFSTTLARSELEPSIRPELEWLEAPVSRALRAAGIGERSLEAVFLLGGSSRIPLVLSLLGRLLGKEPCFDLHPQESAALGAAILGGVDRGEVPDRRLVDIQSHDVGIEHPKGVFAPLLARGRVFPARETRLLTTTESRLELNLLERTGPNAAEGLSLGRIVWELPYQIGEAEVAVELLADERGEIEVTVAQGSSLHLHRVPLRSSIDLGTAEMERYGAEVDRFGRRLLEDKAEELTARGISKLEPAEKILAALNGDRETRLALVCDPDRAVWSAALESPRTTASDVAAIAGLSGLAPEVFREIARNPEWTRHYEVVRNLVQNPRAPAEIALKHLDRLKTFDLEQVLATDELDPVVRDQCRALMKMRF